MNLSFLEHHGGDSTYLIWIKYFTLPCKIQKTNESTRSSLEPFLESFNYIPANSRNIKRHLEKNSIDIESILADDLHFESIQAINIILFSQLVIEQTNSIAKSPNYPLIPQFMMRGFISLSYSIQSIIQTYLANETIQNFRPELFKIINYPLLYLFQCKNEVFNDTIVIVDKYFNAFSCVDTFFRLQPNDPLRQSFLSLLGIVLNVFDFELPHNSFKCLDFLICSFMTGSNKICRIPESADLIRNITILFKKLIDSAKYLDSSRCDSLLTIFLVVFSNIQSLYDQLNQIVNSFIYFGLTFTSKILNNIDEQKSKELTTNLFNFFKWLIDSSSFDSIYEYSNVTNEEDRSQLFHWSTYFSDKSKLTQFSQTKFKDEQISKIAFAFQSIISQADSKRRFILEIFKSCIDVVEDNQLKTAISILFITILLNCEIRLSDLSESFLLDLFLPNSYPSSSINLSFLDFEYNDLYLQFLFEFACQSSEKLSFVLDVIRKFIHNDNFSQIKHFFRFFKSLIQVDSSINFVHYFVESRIIEAIQYGIPKLDNDDEIIKQISVFLQSIAMARPVEVFSAPNYLQLLHSLLLMNNKAITDILAPVFKIGISLSNSLPLQQGRLAARSTLEQIGIILKQVSLTSEKHLNDLALLMVSYLTERISSFDASILKDLIKLGFYDSIATLPSFIKDESSLIQIITFFCKLGKNFPTFYTSMLSTTQLLVLMKEIESSARCIELNNEIIRHLIRFLFNQINYVHRNKMIIQNSFAIPLILNLITDTEYEEKILKLFLEICRQSIENSYEFFTQDMLGYSLRRITKEKFIQTNLDLFKCIGQNFFSKFALNQFFKAMRLASDNKKHHYHQHLMNTFLDLLITDTKVPVSSFFHFSNKDEGIEIGNIQSNIFSFPFSFLTTFKIEDAKIAVKQSNSFDSNSFLPIISIEDDDLVYFAVAIKNSRLVIVHYDRIISNISYSIQGTQWYQLIVLFHQTTIQVSLNDVIFDPFPTQKSLFHNRLNIFFGKSSMNLVNLFVNNSYQNINKEPKPHLELKPKIAKHVSSSVILLSPSNDDLFPDLISVFHGFLGPAFFFKCNSVESVQRDYDKIKQTRQNLKSSFITIVPWQVKKGTISGVITKYDSYLFNGFAVPSCTSLSTVVQNDGIFQCFLPLFVLASHPFDKETDVVNDNSFFYLVLVTFQKILELSSTQELFDEIGGFQLLAGFFSQIKATLFNKMTLVTLSLIYKSLAFNSLKNDMIVNIWLNFDLWSEMSNEFQTFLYKDFVDRIVTDDVLLEIKSFDFILYLIQMPFPEKVRQTQHLLLFNNINEINFCCQLTESQQKEIRTSQWNFFNRCMAVQPSTTTLVNVSMIISFHPDLQIRLLAFEQMENFLKSKSYISAVMDMINDYEYFLTLAFDKAPEIQFHATYCIFLLGKQEISGNFKNKNRNISNASMALTIHLVTPENISNKLFDLGSSCIFQSNDLDAIEIIQMPEILPFVFWISSFLDQTKIDNLAAKLQKSFEPSFQTYSRYFENKSWPFWILNFALIQSKRNMNSFVEFLSSALFPLILSEKIDSFLKFYCFFEVFANFFKCSFDNLLIKLMKLLCAKMNKNQFYSVNFLVQLIFGIFYQIKHDQLNLIDFKEIDHRQMKDFLNFFMKLNVNHFETETITFLFRLSEPIDNDCYDLIIEVMKSLCLLITDNPYTLFYLLSDFSITAFDIFCYLFDYIESNENYKNEAHNLLSDVMKTMSLKSHSQISVNVASLHKHFLFTNLGKIVGASNAILEKREQFVIYYSTKNANVRESLEQMLMSVSMKNQSKFSESFNDFVKAYSQTRLIVSHHNHKMATSFLREVTSNSSPWANDNENDVKWKKITKIDHEGRNLFMKINRNFDDHKKASLLRNSLENHMQSSNEENMEIHSKISNFQKFLNQRDVSFIPAPIEQIKANSAFRATQISLTKRVEGTLYISDTKIVFDGTEFLDTFGTPLKNENHHKFIEFNFLSISFIFWRKILHLDIGIEIFTKSNNSFLFSLSSKEKRTEFLELAKKIIDKTVSFSSKPFEILRKAISSCVQTMPGSELLHNSKLTKLWQAHQISNYTYLYYLNILSGRSFNDISQYPVFPWILADYTSEQIDLNDPKVYRDLSKPIGALNPKCITKMRRKLNECPDPSQYCLYRSHFSSAAFVIGFLIRLEPFSTLHILLQGGSYDIAERLFYSIPQAWKSITNDSQNDFRELIPEFFLDQSFLTNSNGFDLGYLVSESNSGQKKKISDVELPKWAKTPREFITIHRKALESDHVSMNLHNWIDLIFGVNQRSIEHDNLFHPFTYPDSINDNSHDLSVIQGYAANFGVYPTCLFNQPHPKREIETDFGYQFQLPLIESCDKFIISDNGNFLTQKPIIYRIKSNTVLNLNFLLPDNIINMNKQHFFALTRGGTTVSCYSIKTGNEISTFSHNNSIINCLYCAGNKVILTGGADCAVCIWSSVNLKLIGSIPSYSLPIISVFCSSKYDLIVAIDLSHNVFYHSLRNRHFIHSFKLKNCPNDAKHMIKLTDDPLIYILSTSPFSDAKSTIEFFDLIGNCIKVIETDDNIVKIDTISTKSGQNFFFYVNSYKEIYIYETENFTLVKRIVDDILPEFVTRIGDHKSLIAIKKTIPQQYSFIQYDF